MAAMTGIRSGRGSWRQREDLVRVVATAGALIGVLLWYWMAQVNAPRWMFWLDAVSASLALVAVGCFRTPELISIPLWAIAAALLAIVAFFAHVTGFSALLIVSHLVLAVLFLLLIPLGFMGHTGPASDMDAHGRTAAHA